MIDATDAPPRPFIPAVAYPCRHARDLLPMRVMPANRRRRNFSAFLSLFF